MTEKIKIFFLCGAMGGGGTQRQFGLLIKNINKELFEPVVCSIGLSEEDVAAYISKYPTTPEKEKLSAELQYNELAYFHLYRQIKDYAKTIHFVKRNSNKDFIFPLIKICKLLKKEKPDILFCINPLSATFGRIAAILTFRKNVCWGIRGLSNVSLITNKVFKFVNFILDTKTKYYIPNSNTLKQALIDAGIKEKKIQVIYNGINTHTSRKHINRGKVSQVVQVGYIGRFYPIKDCRTLLKAIALLPENISAQFQIYGTGPEEKILKQLAGELNIQSKVFFNGWVENSAQIMDNLDIVCLTSISEGFSSSIAEAQMFGIPVVTTDACGCSEIVENNKTGFVTPVGDPAEFAVKLEKLITDDKLRKNFSAAAHKRANNLYHIDNMIENYESFFAAIAEKNELKQDDRQ